MTQKLSFILGFIVTSGICFGWTTAASALPEDRHYEQVSPVYKAGYGATGISAVSLDGQSVAFYSLGVFNGAPSGSENLDYLARRTELGWSTTPIMPPTSLLASVTGNDLSPSLETIFSFGQQGLNYENRSPDYQIMLHGTGTADVAANWSNVGTVVNHGFTYLGASPDFCHLLITSTEALTPGAGGASLKLYEVDTCEGEGSSLGLVGVNSSGSPINSECAVGLGDENNAEGGLASLANAIDESGDEVFFTECAGREEASPHQLFVRLGGVKTVEVSRPVGLCMPVKGVVPPCLGAAERASANFIGASRDGARVYSTTKAQLASTDKDSGNDLYLARIGCPGVAVECEPAERDLVSQTQVSQDPNGGEAAEVQGVVRVAPDGSRVYFVARGDLLTAGQMQALEAEGREAPRSGADNLYVYDASSGKTAFVADLCSGHELSSSVQDLRCPGSGSDARLWGNVGEAQTAGADGRYLVFASYAQLTSDDANAVKDVYRFDASTGVPTRVSVGEEGYAASGNLGVSGASIAPGHWGMGESGPGVRYQYEMDNRAISEDGSRIVFTSADALSPLASNGLSNVYEWHEGSASLITSGSGEEPVTDAIIAPDGANLYFDTQESLVPQDVDHGLADVYDARIGPVPAVAPAPRRPCEGDACQGPLTNPAPLLRPGSVSQTPGDNAAAKPASKPKSKTVRCRKGYVKRKRRCFRRGKEATKKASRGRRAR